MESHPHQLNQKSSQQSQHVVPQQITNIKHLKHFTHQMPLPQTVKIFSYTRKIQSTKKKKLKAKFQTFKYYQNLQTKQISKILFLTDDLYIDQGVYPFTEPEGKVKNFKQLVNTKRLFTTEAAYIGHQEGFLVIKKMQDVKLGQNGADFETNNDDFELIKLNNEARFNQFLKLMSLNANSISMSIRVIIDESGQKQAKVIDYQFFYREKELAKKNEVYKNNQKQSIKN